MADETQAPIPTPHPALRKLDRYVGTWSMEGHLVGSDELAIKGETTFRWIPGGFFLEQDFRMDFMGMEIQSLELIGYDPETGTFPPRCIRTFAGAAPVPMGGRRRHGEISVNYGPMDSTFTGTWAEDGESFSGGWRPNSTPTKRSTWPTTSAAVGSRRSLVP